MRRILVLVPEYPSANNPQASAFVHTRVKEYQKDAQVRVVIFTKTGDSYLYEGVMVDFAENFSSVYKRYLEFAPNDIFIHFFHRKLYRLVTQVSCPVVIWVHGYEALGWY